MFTTLALSTMLLAYPAPKDREMPDKGPGYLGITFEAADDQAIMITEVRSDGPAIHSGLHVNDIIRKFNNEPINFNTFAKSIIRIRPGTVIPVEVQRGSERVMLKVRIGIRPDDFPYPLPDIDERPATPLDDLLPDLKK